MNNQVAVILVLFLPLFLGVIVLLFSRLINNKCQDAFSRGTKNGYDNGYTEGYKDGRGVGYSEGKDYGEELGIKKGRALAEEAQRQRQIPFWATEFPKESVLEIAQVPYGTVTIQAVTEIPLTDLPGLRAEKVQAALILKLSEQLSQYVEIYDADDYPANSKRFLARLRVLERRPG